MPNLLAIDPGAENCACVMFANGAITWAEFTLMPYVGPVNAIVVERMQADERTRHIDIRHLLACQFNGALCAGSVAGLNANLNPTIHWPTPSEWKGTEPKPVQHARLWEVLSSQERAVLGGDATREAIYAAREKGALRRWAARGDVYPRSFVMHNLLDAAALGAVHLGRLERR